MRGPGGLQDAHPGTGRFPAVVSIPSQPAGAFLVQQPCQGGRERLHCPPSPCCPGCSHLVTHSPGERAGSSPGAPQGTPGPWCWARAPTSWGVRSEVVSGEGSQQTFLAPSLGSRDPAFPLPAGKAAAPEDTVGPRCLPSEQPSLAPDSGVPIPQCPPAAMSPFHGLGLGSLRERLVPAPYPAGLCGLEGGGEALSREMNSWPDPRCQPAQLCSRVTLGTHTAPLYARGPVPTVGLAPALSISVAPSAP